MYLLLYYRNSILFDLPSSDLGRLREFILQNDIDPVCAARDSDYRIVWLDVNYQLETAKNLLYKHLNEKIGSN